MNNEYLKELAKPFHPSAIEFKPGATNGAKDSALGLFYADLRAYQNRLDEVCGMDWSVTFTPWGDRIVCHLTISGVTRSSTGEGDNQSEKSEIAGTAAEAQAFKRACSAFGLGRYLYEFPATWADFDGKKAFTVQGQAKLIKIITEHYKRATKGLPAEATVTPTTSQQSEAPKQETLLDSLNRLGREYYGAEWEKKAPKLADTMSTGQTQLIAELKESEIKRLIVGIQDKISARKAQPVPA